MNERKCDVKKTFRLSSFLVKEIESKGHVPRCKSESDKYRFFLETGLETFNEFERTIDNPDYQNNAHRELENLFKSEMMVKELMEMDAGKVKGLSMALDLVRNKRRI